MSDPAVPPAAPAGPASRSFSTRQVSDALSSLDAVFRDPLGGVRSKKRRTSSPHRKTSTPALEAILARSAHKSTASTANPPPSYEPASLPALLARLATYRLTTFSPSKPSSLSALSCALHGWMHTPSTRERIQCVTCAQGVVLLPPSNGEGWISPSGQRLREGYERLVLAPEGKGHSENCPWRMRPCVRGLYRLAGGGLGVQSGGRRRLLEEVGRQARELDERGLGAIRLELPGEALSLVGEEADKERLVKAVQAVASAADETSTTLSPPSANSILLALFGWTLPSTATPALSRSNSTSSISSLRSIAPSSSSPILSCTFCTRQVLATSYLPSSAPSADGSVTPPTKAFDPLKQHQPFCPFVDAYAGHSPTIAAAASATKGVGVLKPGWQVRLEAVLQRPVGAASAASAASATGAGTMDEAEEEGRAVELTGAGKTKELLSYVRSLLGPKGSSRTGAASAGMAMAAGATPARMA
ncbi:hypothetical protein JCM10450v2_007772 [Rhodotorula kratochvilovae]